MNNLKFKRLFFVLSIFVFIVINIIYYSKKYDILARYQYDDQQLHHKIKDNLNYEEISYIIEYAIAPNLFIDAIDNPYFNIYNIDNYHELVSKYWQLTLNDACSIYELSILNDFNYDLYIDNVYHEIIIHYLTYGDNYFSNSKLVYDPSKIDLFLNNENTVSIFENTNLHMLPLNITNGVELYLDNRVIDDLNAMCAAVSKDLITNDCGNIQIVKAYETYISLEKEYYDAKAKNLSVSDYNLPGHSEHQLGLAFDMKVKNVKQTSFNKTVQYHWLLDNAYKYGFIFSHNDESKNDVESNHLRYIGKYNAKVMYDNKISLEELNNE